MGRYICKFTEGDKAWYMEWSTVVDAPVLYGMSLEDFKEYYRDEYGNSSMAELEKRLAVVETKGTSSRIDASLANLIICNRAGKDGTEMSMQQLIDYYCKYTFTNDIEQEEYQNNKPIGEIVRASN